MTTILNIVWKDGRALRGRLALLALVMVGKFGLGYWIVLGRTLDDATWKLLPKVVMGIGVVEALLVFLIAGALVMEDALVGTQAFWQTRPISGRRLLVAKAAGAFLWLGVPVVVLGLPWWAMHGLGAADMGRAAVLALALRLAVIAPAFFIASLVDSTSRLIAWALVGVAMLITQPLLWTVVLPARFSGLIGAGVIVTDALVVAVAAVVVMVRFRCGLRWPGQLGVAGMLLAVLTGTGWWLRSDGGPLKRPGWSESNAEIGREVTLTWRSARARELRWKVEKASVDSSFSVERVPQGLEVQIGLTQQEWTGMGNSRWTSEYGGAGSRGNRALLKNILGVGPVPPAGEAGLVLATASVPPAVAARLKAAPTAFEMKANLQLVKPVKWCEAPLRAGGWHAGLGHGLRVVALGTPGREGEMRILESRAWWSKDSLGGYGGGRQRESHYYAINRADGTFSRLNDEGSASVLIGGVELGTRTFAVPLPRATGAGKSTEVEVGEQEKRQLVRVGWVEVARFNRTVRTEKFTIEP